MDLAAPSSMNGLRQDLRGALRLLARSPGFGAVVVLTLALAIGATTSVFSIVRGLLLQPLPYPEAGRLVRFFGTSHFSGTGTISPAEYRADHEHLTGGAEHIAFGRATSSLLPVLGVKPAYGRWFTREDEDQGRRVAVLGRALWQRRFAGNPGIVGQTVQISDLPFEVIGVLAEDLELPEHFDAWRPLSMTPAQLTPQARSARGLRVIGRLGRGVTLAGLRSELAVVSARLRASYPDIYPADFGFEMDAVPLLDQMVGHVKLTLWMLFGAVMLVLLMACANVGNLMLARATARQRELARLVQQMVVESLVLAFLGGALGFLIAMWGVDLLLAAGPRDLPRASHVRVDGTVLWFAIAASMASGILFGLMPALASTDSSLGGALRGGSASSAPQPRRLRRALVAADVALALVLLSGTALLLRSFSNVVHVDPGFDPKGAVAMTLGVPGDDQKHRTVFNATLHRLRDLPGTEAAGGVDYAPLSGIANDANFEIEGRPIPQGAQPPDEEIRVVTPGWFEAMRIPLVRGRVFSA
ncbi:MAG: ABC transporter permease, partial [Deltaproteobacteria bacterium]